ncbi:MAG: 2,3-bisphosphoglycerate-independent phosphoglycerate mutase [bacterium]|nr:2,3-bisphosphoglycerate-independent phosphoglycerate mutase [bacterium]
MLSEEIMKELSIPNEKKIVLLVMDGVGGLPHKNGLTELEAAKTPNLDKLAEESALGLTHPIGVGITPGSGPSHLAIFGYDPVRYNIGRGVLEALGLDIHLTNKDLAARANFATKDGNGLITDRRAGRIPTEKNQELCARLQEEIKKIDDVEIIIKHGKEHRFVVLFRGEGLHDGLTDADPQKEGSKVKYTEPLVPEAKKSAVIINKFIDRVGEILKNETKANTALLRGIARVPHIPTMNDLFKLKPGAIATYPMYRGLARLVSMDILKTGETIADEIATLKENYSKYDFFYVHVKKTDSYGEDGNFENKVKIIEETDKIIPDILALNPDVLAVTSDHSTPSLLAGHSWHPNPFLLHGRFIRKSPVTRFTEAECLKGSLGIFYSIDAMPLMLASALKLAKYGA